MFHWYPFNTPDSDRWYFSVLRWQRNPPQLTPYRAAGSEDALDQTPDGKSKVQFIIPRQLSGIAIK